MRLEATARNLTPGRVGLLVGLLAVPLGLASVMLSPLAAAALLVAGISAVFVVLYPRAETTLLLLFLVMQDPLQILVGGVSPAALYIKRADEFFILAVAAGCLCLPAVRHCFVQRRLYLPMALCYAGLLASTLLAPRPFVTVAIDAVLFSKPLLMLAIGFSLATASASLERLLPRVLALLTSVLLTSLVFIWMPELQSQYLGQVSRVGERVGMQVAQGIFINPGTYAFFAVATFCIAYAAYLTYSRTSYLVYAGIAAACVVITWRRKSILAVALVFAVSLLAARARGSRQRAWLLSGVALLLVVTILAPYLQALTSKTIEEYGSSDPYATSRSALYYTSMRIARDHFPLGSGFASFGSHASRLDYSPVYREYGLSGLYGLSPMSPFHIADTFWPMVLGQGGVLVLLAYLAFLFLLGNTALHSVLAAPASRARAYLALVSLLLLVGAFVESMASQLYNSSLQAALLFVPVGIYWRDRFDS